MIRGPEQCKTCEHLGSVPAGAYAGRHPCYLNRGKPGASIACGARTDATQPARPMLPDDHPCPMCSVTCNCGATVLNGAHMTPGPGIRYMPTADRAWLRDRDGEHSLCVHKCDKGYGENWVPREQG